MPTGIGGISGISGASLSTVRSWTTAAIAATSSTEISALTSAQVAVMSTAQVAAINTSGVSSLSTSTVSSLSVDQIFNLIVDQIAALTTKQVSNLKTSQLAALSTVQIKAIETVDLAAITTAQIAALKTNQVASLTTAQVTALTTAQFSQLTTGQIVSMGVEQVRALQTAEIVAMSTGQISKLTSTQLAALTTTQIQAIETIDLKAISTTQIGALTPDQLAALTTNQIAAMTTGQVSSLSTGQLSAMTTTQFGAFSLSQVGALRGQIAAVTTAPIKSWTQLLGSASGGRAISMATDADGSIYISGYTNDNLDGQTNYGGSDAFITKYLPDGTKSWTRLLGANSWDQANSVATGADGSIYVSGYTNGNLDGQTNSGGQDAFITKYMPDGTKSWTRLLGSGSRDEINGTTIGADGSIYVSGSTDGNGQRSAFTTKYLPDGTESWTRLLASVSDHAAFGMTTGADGSIYVSGEASGNLDGQTNSGERDAFIIKYLPDGTKSWTRLLGSDSWDQATSMTTGADGSIYVSGYTYGNLDGQINSGGRDAFITKYLPDGTKSWTRLLGSIATDLSNSVTTVAEGSIYISGDTHGNLDGQTISGYVDAFITKYEIKSNTIIENLSSRQISALNISVISAIATHDIAAISTAQFRALTSSQIRALSTSQVAALSNLQISSLTTAQLLSLTTSQVAAFTTSEVAALTTIQIGKLTSAQLRSMTTKQIAAIETSDIRVLNSTQTSSLSSAQIKAVTTNQIASLTTAQLSALTTGQISSLKAEHVSSLVRDQVANLTSKQLTALTNAQISYLSNVSALKTSQIGSLTSSQLRQLGASQIISLTTAQVAALSSSQIANLKTDQISVLTAVQIKAIETIDLKAITTTQIGAFTLDQLAALTTNQIAALTTGQVSSLSTGQLSAMTTTQFGALSLTQVGALRGQIATISPPVKSWTRLLESTSGDYAIGMTIGADGSIYVSGETGGNLDVIYSNDADAFITKYMPDGTKSWTRLLASDSHDAAYGMTTGADGSIYVSGETSGNLDGQTMSGERAGFITKYLPDGTKSWTRLLTSNVSAGAWGMTTGTDGSIYVSGYTDGDLDGQTNGGGQDAFITKYLPDGTKSWTRLIGSASNDYAHGMTTGADGSIYVSGETFGNFDGQINEKNSDFYSEAFITKYLPDGTKSWTRLLGSNYDEDAYAYGMTTGADGSIYVCGMVYEITEQPNDSYSYSYYDAFITKYLPDGTKSWSRLLGTIEWDAAFSMTTGADGSIYICGDTRGNLDGQPNSGNSDAFITKYLPDGTKSWTQLIGANYEDSAYGMKSSADGSIYICGMTGGDLDGQPNNGGLDAFITKYETRSIISKFSTLQISALNTSVIAAISTNDMAAISTVQFRALSSAQIRALSTSQVAALSNLQISSLTTAQILSLTTSQVAALTTSAVVALTTMQIGKLTSAQLMAMTTKQIAAIETSDIRVLNSTQTSSLSSAQIKTLTTNQIASLTTAQLSALTTAQITYLRVDQISSLVQDQVANLTTKQLASLTTAQISNLSNVSALRTSQIGSLTSAQLRQLGTLQMVALTTAQVAAFSSVQIASLKTDQIAALTTAQIKAIETVDLKAITTTQIGAFTSDQLAALTTNQIAALTTGQVSSLLTGQLSAMTTTQFGALSLTQVGALRGQIATISPPVKSWTRLLGSDAEDFAKGITLGADGSIYISGYTNGNLDGQTNSGDQDAFVTKYLPDGTKSWTRLLGSDSDEFATSITTGADGAMYVSGWTRGNLDGQTNSGDTDAFITKYLPDGTKSWTRLLGSEFHEYSLGTTTSADGSIYVSGATDGNLDGQINRSGSDAFITKYLPDGTRSWTRLLESEIGMAGASSMTTGADGSIYVSGATYGNLDDQTNSGGWDVFTTKYMSDGTKSWSRLLGSASLDEATSMTTGADGSIYVSGYTEGNLDGQINSGGRDAFITKYLPDGTKSWTLLLGTDAEDQANSMIAGADGSIYVSGVTNGNLDGQTNKSGSDAFITKYLTDGTKSWTHLLGSGGVWASGMITGADGSIYICGQTYGDLDGQSNLSNGDAFITKFVINSNSIIGKLSTAQISALNTSVIAAISTKDMAAISTVQFRALSSAQIRALSTSQVAALSNPQISSLTTAQLLSLTTSQVVALTTSAVAALTTLQAASLTSVQIGSLTTSQIASMEAVDTASITTSAIRALTTAQVVALNSAQVSMLKTTQLAALSTVQLSKLETRDLIALTTAQIKSLSTSQLKGLTTDQIKAVTTAQKAALSSAQLNALGLK